MRNEGQPEILLCPRCHVEYEATHDDLASYVCPGCEQRRSFATAKTKPLEAAIERLKEKHGNLFKRNDPAHK
jgi:uncharacterized Zn ribbon protein